MRTNQHLTALHVGNFKAFADTQRIPIKPITLIFGPNSAGKSSIFQSLAFMLGERPGGMPSGRGKPTAGRITDRIELGGRLFDLGGFLQLVHGSDPTRTIELGYEFGAPPRGPHEIDASAREHLVIRVKLGLVPMTDPSGAAASVPRVVGASVAVDGRVFLEASHHADSEQAKAGLLCIDLLDLEHPFGKQVLEHAVGEAERYRVEKPLPAFALRRQVEKALLEYALEVPTGNIERIKLLNPAMVREAVEDATRTGLRVSYGPYMGPFGPEDPVPREPPSSVDVFFALLASELEGLLAEWTHPLGVITSIGPFRDLPPRGFQPDAPAPKRYRNGQDPWGVLKDDAGIRERVNEWLEGHPNLSRGRATHDLMRGSRAALGDSWMKTPYRLIVDHYTADTDLQAALSTALYQRPLSRIERWHLLCSSIPDALDALQEQFEGDPDRVESIMSRLRPWLEKIATATNPESRAALRREADEAIRDEDEAAMRTRQASQDPAPEDQTSQQDEAFLRADGVLASLARQGAASMTRLRLWDVDRRVAVSLQDVGYGVSQVIPVLATAYAAENTIILIEQPEIHLHPALQAELADVFIESATGEQENTFVLETHSEHLILRLLRRIREGALQPDDVAVLFVEPTPAGSQVRHLAIDEDGDFIDEWPGGFFEESFHETFAGR